MIQKMKTFYWLTKAILADRLGLKAIKPGDRGARARLPHLQALEQYV